MDIIEQLNRVWHILAAAFTLFISIVASGHAILFKRDSRSTTLWVSLIWLFPIGGAILYLTFGINRIRRRARQLRAHLTRFQAIPSAPPCSPESVPHHLANAGAHLATLASLIDRVTVRPLLPGNSVEPLINGDEAYPAMLEAIRGAKNSIGFATYIFDRGIAGDQFAKALADAVQRGVEVRVLIDDTGSRYSWPSIVKDLRRLGVTVALFNRAFMSFRVMSINLRNHRKLLVIDGETGFTGGINIRDGHQLHLQPRRPVQDLHFRVKGPVVAHLQEAFADDWLFTTREALRGGKWFPSLSCEGAAIARGIVDGPDEDYDKLRQSIMGALSCARSSVQIVTPYFLPDAALLAAINVAALRGVHVNILLPQENNLPFVQWAMQATLWQVLERGCHVWMTPPPFDHSKLMIVDGHWSLIGSANWDARSLRLNFEFNVECYDGALAQRLSEIVMEKRCGARELTLQDIDRRSLPVRLRDGIARLAIPFL